MRAMLELVDHCRNNREVPDARREMRSPVRRGVGEVTGLDDKLPAGDYAARLKLWYLAATGCVLLLDQVTKYWATLALRGGTQISVIKGFMNFNYTENSGIAFGMLNESNVTWLLVAVSVVAIAVVAFYLVKTSLKHRLLLAALSLLAGGISGNLIDRVRMGSVIDFIELYYDFHAKRYQWPVFNIADTAITMGALLLAIDLFFAPRAARSHAPESEVAEVPSEN
jgi:signal peptidase II